MMMLKNKWLWLPLLAFTGLVHADEQSLKAKLETLMPGAKIESLTPVEGTKLYETVISGEVIYFSEDARYAFQGDVISLETRENLTENKRVSMRKAKLDALDEKDMIIYAPKKYDYTLTVFTDIDCGYCRKLHQEMAEYNKLGIRIRYMAFPRAGIGSESYDKAVNVWCADDRHKAMDEAKQGIEIASASCNNPVEADYEIGRELGVRGTPALFLESGDVLPGYVPPTKLKQILDEQASDHS